jgi:hypothetical protein
MVQLILGYSELLNKQYSKTDKGTFTLFLLVKSDKFEFSDHDSRVISDVNSMDAEDVGFPSKMEIICMKS